METRYFFSIGNFAFMGSFICFVFHLSYCQCWWKMLVMEVLFKNWLKLLCFLCGHNSFWNVSCLWLCMFFFCVPFPVYRYYLKFEHHFMDISYQLQIRKHSFHNFWCDVWPYLQEGLVYDLVLFIHSCNSGVMEDYYRCLWKC